MKVLLLGVGMQGKAALHDLVRLDEVTRILAADLDLGALEAHAISCQYGTRVECQSVDAREPTQIAALFRQRPDIAINLLPTPFMDTVTEAAVRHGVHLVQTSYTTPGVQALAEESMAARVTILSEFGLDPGIDLVLLGEAVRGLDRIVSIRSYGTGIPERDAADTPLRYKVTWTFEGVLSAYVRDSMVVRNGETVAIPGTEIFGPENIHEIQIKELGRLEAYPNGNAAKYAALLGLETTTLKEIGRYALRWPGHCAFWKNLVDLHLLDDEPVIVDGQVVDRRRFLAAAIEPHIQLGPHERDIALVRIEVTGTRAGQTVRRMLQVMDRRDLASGLSAMSRTVGFTAVIGAWAIGTGKLTQHGVLSPVKNFPFELLAQQLSNRGISVTSESSIIAVE